MAAAPRSSLAILATFCACSASSRTSFVGTAREPVIDASAVLVHPLSEAPAAHEVLGVVTATCETYDGASGLVEAPCDDPTLLADARGEAARRGGTLLVEPACERQVIERTVEPLKGGGARVHERRRVRCRATVARGGVAPVKSAPSASARPPEADAAMLEETLVVGGSTLRSRLALADPRATRAPIDTDATAELAHPPSDAPKLGHVQVACTEPCSSSLARRGLKAAGARIGARYLVQVTCDVIADRWRCEGDAHGDP
ncbi:MAG: hypothetical protein FJ096_16715 [Deltaproteobacteria bacterium]|nr:hypothetical protein [Deltaproteobacteria bacterium]